MSKRASLAAVFVLVLSIAAPVRAGADTILADSGFRPGANGFSFPNYGSGFTDLLPEDIRTIFGDGVCENGPTPPCVLTPPGQQWMEATNRAMQGGHCYGFSVAALMFFKSPGSQQGFGAQNTPGLPLHGNERLQRFIASTWAFQKFASVRAGAISGTPNQVLGALITHLRNTQVSPETYTFGFFKRDGTGGHAVTPFGVVDKGNGILTAAIYDNNYPNVTREITFDTNADTWTYEGSTNPSEPADTYEGDAETRSIFLFPTTPGVPQQPCPFCASGEAAVASTETQTIYLQSDAVTHPHLLITDDQGRRTGFAGRTFVNEIPGAQIHQQFLAPPATYKSGQEPDYELPADQDLTLLIDGTDMRRKDTVEVLSIGRGFDIGLIGTVLPRERDTLRLLRGGAELGFTAGGSRSPTFQIGSERPGADYAFSIRPQQLTRHDSIGIATTNDSLTIDVSALRRQGRWNIDFTRFEGDTALRFFHPGLVLPARSTARLLFPSFDNEGEAVSLEITLANGQVVQRQLEDRG